MTIKIPPENFLDKILRHLGKKRQIIFPEAADKIYQEKGPYIQIIAKRENFFKALVRRKVIRKK